MTQSVPITGGYVAWVDDEDYVRVISAGPWQAREDHRGVYAQRTIHSGRRSTTTTMHRFLAAWSGLVDHINGDGLDNRRANLRPATPAQNAQNRQQRQDSTTAYKGVARTGAGRAKPWQARIWLDGRNKYLGMFDTPDDAARAYDAAALTAWGEYARLNFPKETA